MDHNKNRFYLLFPFLLGVAIAAGIFIGWYLSGNRQPQSMIFNFGRADKLRDVLNYIEKQYVDTLDPGQLEENAIVALLEQLDPHSAYLPAEDLLAANEQLQGNFEGIGIEFNIQKDTIMVVAAISGGPSATLGIRSGDRIVQIEGNTVAGIGIKNEQVIKQLRGKGGTKVIVGILRPGQDKIQEYTITRGKIPLYSIETGYMITPDIGYIRISRFAATTYEEYKKAFNELRNEGMKKLILDLRDNPGGYLNAAVDLSDEFLSGGKQIVYTEGKARPREDYTATSKGSFEEGGLVILIDEGSASASEIVSGAVQDNDRGWVVGRRSFGKGLVQEEVKFKDGSAMRLTIARYYTPTGRSIQKPYEKGHEAYFHELMDRYERGELDAPDTNRRDSIVFLTPAGRTVYGGGGIMPDVFVPLDTAGYSGYVSEIASKGLFNRFAFEYTDRQRSALLERYRSPAVFARSFPATSVMPEFYAFVEKNGIRPDPAGLKKSAQRIENQVTALIARALYGNTGFYTVYNTRDNAVKKAIELLNSDKLVSHTQPGKF